MGAMVPTTEPQEAANIDLEEQIPADLGRGHRSKVPSTRLRDYVVNTVTIECPLSLSSSSPSPQLSSGSVYPLSEFLSCEKFLCCIAAS